jgi:hypothetical protein
MLMHCCRDVFAPLHGNARGAPLSIVSRVRYRGDVFTEPLPNNKLFRLSGVMSQYEGEVKNMEAYGANDDTSCRILSGCCKANIQNRILIFDLFHFYRTENIQIFLYPS